MKEGESGSITKKEVRHAALPAPPCPLSPLWGPRHSEREPYVPTAAPALLCPQFAIHMSNVMPVDDEDEE